MRDLPRWSLAVTFFLLHPYAASAGPDDETAVLAVMDKLFAAVRSGNPDDWRAIQLAEGTRISFRPVPDGESGAFQMRIVDSEELIAGMSNDGHDYLERWTGKPTVLIRGPMAVVWGEYEFRLDGEFSHCGVDSADLVRQGGEWKVANLMWTVEVQGCAKGPGK